MAEKIYINKAEDKYLKKVVYQVDINTNEIIDVAEDGTQTVVSYEEVKELYEMGVLMLYKPMAPGELMTPVCGVDMVTMGGTYDILVYSFISEGYETYKSAPKVTE